MLGRIKVVESPYATVSSVVTQFVSLSSTASPLWSRDSSGNLISPLIDGEILKVVCNYTGGYSTSVWSLRTRDTPSENILLLTGTDTVETIYPRIAAQLKWGANYGITTSGATFVVPYVAHGSLLASCSGVVGEGLQFKVYYR